MDNRSLAGPRPMLIVMMLAALAWPSQAQEPPAASPVPAAEESALPPEAPPVAEPLPPGTPTIALARAVALSLERNFGVLNAADAVTTSRLREGVSRAQFYPKLTPRYQRSQENSQFGLDAAQRLPWTGGSVTATAQLLSVLDQTGVTPAPLPRTSDFRLLLTQPLL